MRFTISILDISRLKIATPLLLVNRDVTGQIEGKGSLAHGGPRSQDDQFEPAENPVTNPSRSRKPVRQPMVGCPSVFLPLQLGEVLVYADPDRLEFSGDAVLGDVEDHLLGLVDQLGRRLLPPVAHLGDLAADVDQGPQIVVLPHDLGVIPALVAAGTAVTRLWMNARPPTNSGQPYWPAPPTQ